MTAMETPSIDMTGPAGTALPTGCGRCPAARLAQRLPPEQRGKKASARGLVALFAPGCSFGLGLFGLAAQGRAEWAWIAAAGRWPWELWCIAVAGTTATAGGVADWAYHRWGVGCVVAAAERRCELMAMALGGGTLFVLMAAASVSARPLDWLLPAVAVVVATTVMICYDEFIFHRKRCRRLETVLHRVLVLGQGAAWMAWAHWCFVRGGNHGMG